MFFWTALCLEICAAIRKGENYLTLNVCLVAGVKAETTLRLDAKYNKAFKFASQDKAQENARKGKGKVCDDLLESYITRDAPQHPRSGTRGHG